MFDLTLEYAKAFEHQKGKPISEDNMQEMVLDKIFPGYVFIRNKMIPNSDRRFRPDFRCEELKLIIEFNGKDHYQKASVIARDYEKSDFYKKMGYKVVEWPFFVQPDKNTIKSLFKQIPYTKVEHFSDYHQGFCRKGGILPADFCYLGIYRYNRDLSELDEETILRIEWSLIVKEFLYDKEIVRDPIHPIPNEFEVYPDGHRTWWRKVHSYSLEEIRTIGSSII